MEPALKHPRTVLEGSGILECISKNSSLSVSRSTHPEQGNLVVVVKKHASLPFDNSSPLTQPDKTAVQILDICMGNRRNSLVPICRQDIVQGTQVPARIEGRQHLFRRFDGVLIY